MMCEKNCVNIEMEFAGRVTLAAQLNALPVIFELRLRNLSEHKLEQVACMVSATPGIIRAKTFLINALDAGGEAVLRNLELEMDCAFLASLTGRAEVELAVEASAGDGAALGRRVFAAEAFAADQWLGLDTFPELLCAFVTPDIEAVAALADEAAKELKLATGRAAFDGRQSGSKRRSYEICAAIFRAIQNRGFARASSPEASPSVPPSPSAPMRPPLPFNSPGHRIRFADSVCAGGIGSSLDFSLLFASVMERCGLHPVVLFQEDRAYAGCHLTDAYFPDAPMDDLQALRKLAELDEFLVLDAAMAAGAEAPFAEAEAFARKNYLKADDKFLCAVDVARARRGGIRPLPLKRGGGADGAAPEFALKLPPPPHSADEASRELRQNIAPDAGGSAGAKDRVARWQQRLLDLSLRNRLLNARDTKQIVPIICSDIAALEDKIAANASVSLNPLSDLLGENEAQAVAAKRGETAPDDKLRGLLGAELERRRLWSPLPPPELSRRMTKLYRQSRSDIEEGGVNTLFLALGFLEWRAAPDDERAFLAPIALLPVRLSRPSAQSEISIVRLDEEAVPNVTLLEMLRREFQLAVPGLDPLPLDDSGADIARVMQIFRQAVRSMRGWEIREEARLGQFSFNKFIMWNDLANRAAELRQNPIVAHLIDGGGAYDDGVEIFDPAALEAHYDAGRLYCPSSADASQLAAVMYAERGKSFVLHGPPGTGKSQTITNLIAQLLAAGKRVLFVSEKKAALDVVHKRLSALGLGPFCLELHSNKAGKAEVLKQFAEALAVAPTPPPADWDSAAAQWTALRDELNAYAAALHAQYPNGLSAYRCLAALLDSERDCGNEAAHARGARAPRLIAADFLAQNRADLDALRDSAASLAAAIADTPADARAAFAFLPELEWSRELERGLSEAAPALADALAAHRAAIAEIRAALALGAPPETAADSASSRAADIAADSTTAASAVSAFCHTLASARAALAARGTAFPAPLLDALALAAGAAPTLRRHLAAARAIQKLAAALAPYDLAALAEFDLKRIAADIRDNAERFILIRVFRNKALLRKLARVKLPAAAPLNIAELKTLIETLAARDAARARFQLENNGELAAAFHPLWSIEKTEDPAALDAFSELLDQAEKIHSARPIFRDATEAPASTSAPAPLPAAREISDYLNSTASPPSPDNYTRSAAACENLRRAIADFEARLGFPLPSAGLLALERSLRAIPAQIPGLRRAVIWNRLRRAASALGLDAWIAALERGDIAPADSAARFERAIASAMLDQILAADKTLRDFIGAAHDARVEKFRLADERLMRLSRAAIHARLSARVAATLGAPAPQPLHAANSPAAAAFPAPAPAPARRAATRATPAAAELGILKRECEKRARHKPPRVLLSAITALLPALKPCFLMSPLSVAQYLPADFDAFDALVFDEASQIPVWDAIGAIARARQLIVVGDPKQMPPANFFQKNDSDADDSDADADLADAEDLESILDECLAAGLHSAHLNWHYRSRHESLIAFSNQHYYGGRLHTFPAAADGAPHLGVRLRHVPNGVYDRTKTRTNPAEAAAVVERAASLLRDPATARKSIGIVTFSQAQQTLIEDLLDRAAAADPALEPLLAANPDEPLFVKNLENVQGDERDIIIFSIGYAPDKDGRFTMNFGPLNRHGGERRLNVAITRAKEQILVCSSIRAHQIDLARATAVGAAHLRHFLEYAARESSAADLFANAAINANANPGPSAATAFRDAIARFLIANGHQIRTSIGHSGARIDIAVLHPFKPGEYLLGIECDGAAYAAAPSARDRDLLRHSILSGLGWRMHRVWSADWHHDRALSQRNLQTAIAAALAAAANPAQPTGFATK